MSIILDWKMFYPTKPSFLHTCMFCFKTRSNIPDLKAKNCSYGLGHEFLEEIEEKILPPKQEKKVDSKLCTKCGLHPKNPLSSQNNCQHNYL